MIDDRLEELASLHALDLLEGAEREEFLSALARDPELRGRVRNLRDASTYLSLTAPDAAPPAELRARVLDSVDRLMAPGKARSRVVRIPALVPWLIAASVALAAAWAQSRYTRVREENAALSSQRQAAEVALAQTRTDLDEAKRQLTASSLQVASLSDKLKSEGDLAHYKISALASMLGNSPEAIAVAVWDPSRQQGVLSVEKLPALAPEKDYQLWVIDKQYPNPVNGGVFVVDPATGEAHIVFRADKHVDSIAKFAVSLERKGGVPKAEGPIVLLSR